MARGTRRPHPRRVRSKPVKFSGSKKSGGCLVLIAALAALPVVMTWAADLIT